MPSSARLPVPTTLPSHPHTRPQPLSIPTTKSTSLSGHKRKRPSPTIDPTSTSVYGTSVGKDSEASGVGRKEICLPSGSGTGGGSVSGNGGAKGSQRRSKSSGDVIGLGSGSGIGIGLATPLPSSLLASGGDKAFNFNIGSGSGSTSKRTTSPIPIPPSSTDTKTPTTPGPRPRSILKTSSLRGRTRSKPSIKDNDELPKKEEQDSIDMEEKVVTGERNAQAAGGIDDAYRRGMMRVFVREALNGAMQGNPSAYTELLTPFTPSFTTPHPPLPPLLPLLLALTSNISLLHAPYHTELIKAIINLPWASAGDEGFVRVYTGFLGVLCSGRMEWVGEVVGMGVRGLRWHPTLPTLPDSPPITRQTYHTRHLSLLHHLHTLIPTLPSILSPLLQKSLPYKRDDLLSLETYVRNILRLVEGCPEVAGGVWELVLGRCVGVDVEIQLEMGELEEEDLPLGQEQVGEDGEVAAGEKIKIDPFDLLVSETYNPTSTSLNGNGDAEAEEEDPDADLDLNIEEMSSEEETVDGESEPEQIEMDEKRRKRLVGLGGKVDALVRRLLEHLERVFVGPQAQEGSDGNGATVLHRSYTTPESRLIHFQTLLGIFDRLILPTFQCRRSQFLVFWLCSLDLQYTDLFLGLLVSRALYETHLPAVIRVSAASYIGSFVARAKYVEEEQVRSVLQYLTAYIDGKLVEVQDDPKGMAGSGGLMVFYTVFQAVMMIYCFRWKALVLQHGAEGGIGAMEESMADEMDFELEEENLEGMGPKIMCVGTGRETGGVGGKIEWMQDLDVVKRAINSKLNPLMACYPVVVDMFAKIAYKNDFMYCHSIITANQATLESARFGTTLSLNDIGFKAPSTSLSRSNSARTASSRKGGAEQRYVLPLLGKQSLVDINLDKFFPFDPIDLPRCRSFVERHYREWQEVAIPLDDDEDEDETEGETEDDGTDYSGSYAGSGQYLGVGGSGSEDDEGFSKSFEGMSISQREREMRIPVGLTA